MMKKKFDAVSDGFSVPSLAGYFAAVVLLLSMLLGWHVSVLGFVLVLIVYYVFFYILLLIYQKIVVKLLCFMGGYILEKIKHIKETKEAASR